MSIQSPTKESQEAMQAKTQAVPPMNVGSGLPEGGTVGQVLTKTATGAAWDDVPEELPEGGTTGQVLTKTASGTAWGNIPEELPEGGTEGQVLTLEVPEGETDPVPTWADPEEELPAGGTTGQVLTKTANGCAWANAASGGVPKFPVTFTTNEYLFDDGGEQDPVSDFHAVNLTLSGSFPNVYELGTELFALEVTIRDGNNKEFTGIMLGRLTGTGSTGYSKYMMRLTGTLVGAYPPNEGLNWGPPADYIIQDAVLYVNRTSSPWTYKYWGKVTALDA